MTGMIRPLPSTVIDVRPDGSVGLQDTSGRPLPDDTKIVLSAIDQAKLLASYAEAGIQIGRYLGSKAGMQAGAEAGVKAGARYVFDTTRIRRDVVRDADGKIVASVESREPLP